MSYEPKPTDAQLRLFWDHKEISDRLGTWCRCVDTRNLDPMAEVFDAATDSVRALWPGAAHLVPVAARRDVGSTPVIELRGTPDDPLQFPTALAESDTITIGEFYTKISTAIGVLSPGIFVNPPRNQVGPDLMPESIIVTDKTTAQQAISTIIEQGEGTHTSPEEVVGPGYAHYYRYMQIKKQHFLVKTPGIPPGYAYSGAPLSFDPSGVYDVPPSTSPSLASDNFNYTYTSLLGALHVMFNGQNNQAQFNRALGLMMSLEGQAKAMLAGIPNPALPVGPTFVYQPVTPMTPNA